MDYDTLARKLDMLSAELDAAAGAAAALAVYGRAILLPGRAAARLASRALARAHILQAAGVGTAPAGKVR